ncbi:MAG: hypothetical protein U0670_07110 [Anaerolineae bacterium]
MNRKVLLIIVFVVSLFVLVMPTFAGSTIIDGTLTGGATLSNGKPQYPDCSGPIDNSFTGLYFQLRTFQVTVDGTYDYYDIGYLDDSDSYSTIDMEVSFYTGSAANFDPSDPLGNSCFFNADDTGSADLVAGVTYTMMITTNSDNPDTGYFIFSLTGPGDVVFVGGDCPYILPTTAVQHQIPAGAPAFYAADASAATGFNIPAGTWWTYGSSGDFTHVWVACQATPVWVPSNAVAP